MKPLFNIGQVYNIIFVLFYFLCISIFFTSPSEGALSYNLNGSFGTPNSNTERLVTTLYTEQKKEIIRAMYTLNWRLRASFS